jgi:four helix bundle protein
MILSFRGITFLRAFPGGWMLAEELQERTKRAALACMGLAGRHQRWSAGEVLAHQLIRAASSVAANYRAACRAKSRRDFVYKLRVIVEEADEALFWLEMYQESGEMPSSEVTPLIDEFSQLLKIFAASLHTARLNLRVQGPKP